MHSYGKYILIPFGYDIVLPSDFNKLFQLATKVKAKIIKYDYIVGNAAATLYPTAG